MRIEQHGGGLRGVEVVIEGPAQGSAAFGLGVFGVGLLGGIGPEQVVEGVTARRGLGEQWQRASSRSWVRAWAGSVRPGWRRPGR